MTDDEDLETTRQIIPKEKLDSSETAFSALNVHHAETLGAIFLLLEITGAVSHSCTSGHQKTSKERKVNITLDDKLSHNFVSKYKSELKVALSNAKRNAKNLKKFIERKQMINKKVIKECKKSPSLRGVPQIKSGETFQENWVEVLSDDFRRLTTIRQFVQTAMDDSHQYSHPYNDKYKKLLSSLNTSMSVCLCYVEQLSDSNNQELSRDITAVVVPRMYKKMANQTVIDRRNCMIVRDVYNMLEDMLKWYK